MYKKVHLFCGSEFGGASFPNDQASLRTRSGGVNRPYGAGRNPKFFGKRRPCLLVSALSGEAHAGARSQWPKIRPEWDEKRAEVAVGDGTGDSRGLRQREQLRLVVGAALPQREERDSEFASNGDDGALLR